MSSEILVADRGGRLQESASVIQLFRQDDKTLQLRFVAHSERHVKVIYRISLAEGNLRTVIYAVCYQFTKSFTPRT